MSNIAPPDDEHVARYCRPKILADGNPTGASFELRANEEFLSVNWLEYFNDPSFAACVERVRQVIRIDVNHNGQFAILNILDVKSAGNNAGCSLQVKHMPIPPDESHTGIMGYTEADLEVSEELALIVKEMYPGIETT